MFIIPIICFAGGLALMGRTKPESTVRKLVALGPRTGLVYQVEDLPDTQTVIVRAPGNRAVAQFLRASVRDGRSPGLVYSHGSGDPAALKAIANDFGVPSRAPAAVPAPKDGAKDGAKASDAGKGRAP